MGEVIRLIIPVVIFVAVIILALYLFAQFVRRTSMFFPARYPEGAWEPSAYAIHPQDVSFTSDDGVRLHGWWFRAADPHAPLLIFFHGNAGNITDRGTTAAELARRGIAVFLFDWRGYGRSEGQPTESGLFYDALAAYDFALAGSPYRWGDYAAGEKIDHLDAMTLEEAEHQIATRLYQNTAKVHFNLHEQAQGQFKRRLIYGGVVISLARALSFNGLANAFHIAAINGGRHVAPCFAGDTVYAWSEVLETAEIAGRSDIGALRTRLVAVKNRACADFPLRNGKGDYEDGVILDLDCCLVLPR